MQFHAKYPLFDSQSERGFTFTYAILQRMYKLISAFATEKVYISENQFLLEY